MINNNFVWCTLHLNLPCTIYNLVSDVGTSSLTLSIILDWSQQHRDNFMSKQFLQLCYVVCSFNKIRYFTFAFFTLYTMLSNVLHLKNIFLNNIRCMFSLIFLHPLLLSYWILYTSCSFQVVPSGAALCIKMCSFFSSSI